ncbi:MAG: twin-arginine translocase TatA/TatE family subunit [Opitutales bacterium]|nr:twin-arginine translocase TatA/TatE family subunit [Opitutales bacterium]
MPFGIVPTELVIIVIVLALLFGTQRLPVLGSSMGRAIQNFRRGLSGEDRDL